MKEIIIDGVIYIPKESNSSNKKIIRTYSAGVFFGEIESRNGREVIIKNAIRLWYWKGAASLSQMAVDGVSIPSECKFAKPVSKIEVLEVIEILDCTDEAIKSIEGVDPWVA